VFPVLDVHTKGFVLIFPKSMGVIRANHFTEGFRLIKVAARLIWIKWSKSATVHDNKGDKP
jgi:hypothetical protein